MIWFLITCIILSIVWIMRHSMFQNDMLNAMLSFRDEWIVLRTLQLQLGNLSDEYLDGELPSGMLFPWVRMFYELNTSENFLEDLTDNLRMFPNPDYKELVKYNKGEWKYSRKY
jgi:hypothetical protein